MLTRKLGRKGTALVLAAGFVMLMPELSAAQGELMTIDFQSAPPYRMQPGNVLLEVVSPTFEGPKAFGKMWHFQHANAGGSGFNSRAYMRFFWWDWDVSQTGHGSNQGGWTEAFTPPGGWAQYGMGPFYLRFRIRVSSPLVPHAPNAQGCDGDTQMKWFVWNGFTSEGTDRVIMMFHSGDFSGGSMANETSIQLRAGISGSFAMTRFPNNQWVHVQAGWRWGPESTGFQRIWINNNNVNAPNVSNNQFNDLDMWPTPDHWGNPAGPQGLQNQFFFGDIANTGSCVAEDAVIDVMDAELATQFDQSWFQAGGTEMPEKPTGLHVCPGPSCPTGFQALLNNAVMPFAALGVMIGMRRIRRDD